MSDHPLDRIVLLAEEELSEADAREVRRHMDECTPCRAYFDRCCGLMERLSPPASESTFSDLMFRRSACERLAEAATLHACGEEDPEVADHLTRCPRCAETDAEIRKLGASIRGLGRSRATFAGLQMRMRPAARWLPVFACAASVLIAVGVVRLLLPPSSPRPPSPLRKEAEPPVGPALVLAARWGEVLQKSEDSVQLDAAVRGLQGMGTPAAEDWLARGLGHGEPGDSLILNALVKMRSRRATPELVRRLRTPRRRPALEALATLKDPSALPAMADCLGDPACRTRVGELLARFESANLIETCKHHPNAVWFAIVDDADLHAYLMERASKDGGFRAALAQVGPGAVAFLVRASKISEFRESLDRCPRSLVESGVARALRQADLRGRALDLIVGMRLTKLVPELRRDGAEDVLPILAKLQDATAVDHLLRLLADPRRAKAAAESLALVDASLLAKRARGLLRDARLIRPLVSALGRLRGSELGPFFVDALALPEARGTAFEALAKLRYRPAVPALTPFLRSETIGPQAQKTLVEITGQDFGTDRSRWDRWWRKNS